MLGMLGWLQPGSADMSMRTREGAWPSKWATPEMVPVVAGLTLGAILMVPVLGGGAGVGVGAEVVGAGADLQPVRLRRQRITTCGVREVTVFLGSLEEVSADWGVCCGSLC